MSSVNIVGVLKTPTGSVLGNTQIRLRSVTSHTGNTVRYAYEDIAIPANGSYNFTLLYGEYSVYIYYSGSFRLSGVVSINAADVAAHPASQYTLETILDTFKLETSSILEDVYVINGSNGIDGTNGIDGKNGVDGSTIYTQFYWSSNGVDFHPTVTADDYYFKTRTVTNSVAGPWSAVSKFRPEAGVDYNTNGIDASVYATQAAQSAQVAENASALANDTNLQIELNVAAAHNSEVIATEAAERASNSAEIAVAAAANIAAIALPVKNTTNGHRAVTIDADGKVIYVSADDLTHANRVLGITLEAVTVVDAPIKIVQSGSVTEPSWAFNTGPVYVGTNGQLTQNLSGLLFVQQVGVAVSATTLIVDIHPSIVIEV